MSVNGRAGLDALAPAGFRALLGSSLARELGVPEDKWVHIHAVTAATELKLSQRPDLAGNPASLASVDAALARAGKGMGDMRYIDFYSCFAIPVFNQCDHFGLSVDDPRGLVEQVLESSGHHLAPDHAPLRALRVLENAAPVDAVDGSLAAWSIVGEANEALDTKASVDSSAVMIAPWASSAGWVTSTSARGWTGCPAVTWGSWSSTVT
jgi:hypothetical protein